MKPYLGLAAWVVRRRVVKGVVVPVMAMLSVVLAELAPVHGETAVAGLSPSEEMALFAAAGFKIAGNGQYRRCNEDPVSLSYHPGQMELMDLNGDGRSEAWITEHSLFCYGDRGQYFVLLTRVPGGWQPVLEAVGIAVIKDSGYQGWPDIAIGGHDLDVTPLYRWNGKAYVRGNP